jgi:F0F1-type ATP synthase membrane subunit a
VLFSLVTEFVLNFVLVDSTLASDVANILDVLSLADVCGDVSAVVTEAREFSGVRNARVSQRARVSSAQVLVLETLTTRFVDVVLAGSLGEFTTTAVVVVITAVEALVVCCGEPFALLGRGLSSVAALVESNSVFSLTLALFEIFALVVRPLSLTLRIVANLTTGTLLSGLLVANSSVALVDSLSATSIAGTAASVVAAGTVVLGLSAVESFVGVLQVYVFTTLGLAYTTVLRD